MRKIVRVIVLIIAALISMVSYFGYQQIFAPLSESNEIILVPRETSFDVLKDSLQAHGLMRNTSFYDFFCTQKRFSKIHPGRYLVSAEMDLNSMVNMLRLGAQKPLNILFNNASTLEDLAGKLASQIEADSIDLVAAFNSQLFFSTYNLDEASARKLFVPNTYEVYWTITPVEFLERMQKEYTQFWTPERLLQAKNIGLTAHEVSVLASIVQKETAKSDEQPIVAGLYLNRLNKGMKLQSDPTVIYALHERYGFDRVIKRVLKKDLKIASKYNTYYTKGLPPNPICIPEMSALLSVLNAKTHTHIYMCAKADFSGYHNFTNSWSVHKRNAKRFQKALSNKGVMR
jgi:UPF0755 protein